MRLMLVATLVLISLQVALGEIVGAVANYPTTAVPINSIGALFSAMYSAAGPMIFVHASNGILILLVSIGNVILSRRYHKRSETTSTIAGLVSVAVALIGGYLLAVSDFTNFGGVLLMINSALASYAFFFIALYYTK